jgi:hypothetical protein
MQTIDSDGATNAVARLPKPTSLIPNPVDKNLRSCVLIELWLFVAGMYRRSELDDDADDAIKEAEKLVALMEIDVGRISSSAKSFSNPGWGGAKSVDELWGDIWTEVSATNCSYLQNLTLSSAVISAEHAPLHTAQWTVTKKRSASVPITPKQSLASPSYYSTSTMRKWLLKPTMQCQTIFLAGMTALTQPARPLQM